MNEELLEKVLHCPRLPSLPAIAAEVIEQCRCDDTDGRQIAATISNDPALSAKILRTVNSSYYGLSQPVSTITHALVILGLNSVKTLALGFSLVSHFKSGSGETFDVAPLWRRTLYAAVAARLIAQRTGLPEEEAFLGGLMQDIGVIAMIQALGDEYVELLAEVGEDHPALWRLERKRINLDHPRVGEALAIRYRLPPVLIAPIRHHERPEQALPRLRPMVHAVALGAMAADICRHKGVRSAAAEEFARHAYRWFHIQEPDAAALLEEIKRGTADVARLFEIGTGPAIAPDTLLAEANEVLLELSLKTSRDAAELEQLNRQLEIKAMTDPLTGAANRGRFNDALCLQFEHATRQHQPLSLILMDVDDFKMINDTHGHIAGDKVLIVLTETLRANSPERAVVARYGGEEFAVIIPGMDRREAAGLAERLRAAIEQTPAEADDGLMLSITASIGVASYDGLRFFERPEQLIKAADQAVYAAKAAGRNRVRVFAPKPRQPQPSG